MIPDPANPYHSPQEVCKTPESRESPKHMLGLPIRVIGKPRRNDIEAMLDLHRGLHKHGIGRWRWLLAQIIFATLVISAVILLIQHPTWIPSYVWLGFTLFGLYWFAWEEPRAHRALVDVLEGQALEREFLIENEGLMIRSADENLSYEWTAFTSFRDSHDQVLLYEGNYFIPVCRRWFASDEEWQRFVVFLGHRVDMA
jgi:hypothetical protein